MSYAKLVCSVYVRRLVIVGALLHVVACSGQVATLDPSEDYAQALCDRAAMCGAPFEESIAQAVDRRPEDQECASDMASWMAGQAPPARDPGACLRALASAVRAGGCEVAFTMPEVCK